MNIFYEIYVYFNTDIFNPSLSKEFYVQLSTAMGGRVKLPPHVNRYNFVAFEDFVTKHWGYLSRKITYPSLECKIFLKCRVTLMMSPMTSKASYCKPWFLILIVVVLANQSCPRVTFLGPDPTRPGETLTRPDPTRDCRQKVWPDPTRGPTLPPYVHSLIE